MLIICGFYNYMIIYLIKSNIYAIIRISLDNSFSSVYSADQIIPGEKENLSCLFTGILFHNTFYDYFLNVG